jgi:predicted nucleotidyltransferase
MQLEINEEIVDHIIKTELRESIDGVKRDIKALKKNKSRAPYEDADLKHGEEILLHLEAVYDYFGGNIK